MKYVIVLLLSIVSVAFAAESNSSDELALHLKEAISAKDIQKVLDLYYLVGMSEADIARTKDRIPSQLFEIPTVSVVALPLNDSLEERQISRIRGDMRVSITAQPIGKIEFEQKSTDGKLIMKSGLPVGIIGGKYYHLGITIERIQK